MQHFPKPPTQFLHIKFNGLLILTKNQKKSNITFITVLLWNYLNCSKYCHLLTGYQTPKFNIDYLYSWAQVMNLTEVTKNM